MPRPFLPSGGWRIKPADLADYYVNAAEICQLPMPAFGDGVVAALPALYREPLERYGAERRMWQMSVPTRFGEVYGPELAAAPSVRCLLNATVVEIEIADGGVAATRLRVKTLAGNGSHVAARVFVLAAGGIENARLLLQPTPVRPRGVGKEHDQVGRYFMLHPMLHAGTVLAGDRNGAMLRGDSDVFVGGLSLSSAEQHARELPNHVVNFLRGRPRAVQFSPMRPARP